jgi:hypothetical protein
METKYQQETSELLHTLDQIDMVDIYRVFHPTTAMHTLFSGHRTVSKIDHILEHKASLNKFKKTEIILCIISDHNGIKLDVNNKRNPRKIFKHMETKKQLLKNQWVSKVIREEIKKFLESNENENVTYQSVWDIVKAMLR